MLQFSAVMVAHFYAYVSLMTCNGTWGKYVKVLAVATMFQIPVSVYSPAHSNSAMVKYEPSFQTTSIAPAQYISITHKGNHYGAVRMGTSDLSALTVQGLGTVDHLSVNIDSFNQRIFFYYHIPVQQQQTYKKA